MKFLNLPTLTAVLAIVAPSVLAKSGPTAICYVEVNGNSISNVGKYTLDDGSNVFDIAIIFAANINNNNGQAVVYNNDQVQATLNQASTTIQPLQAKGIKVLLSILGNHQGVGISNFQSYDAAVNFASNVAGIVAQYGLDGVDLDDEYADYNSTPTQQSVAWAIQALRAALGSKLLTFYNFGDASGLLSQSDASVGSQLDYSWNAVYSTYQAPSIPGLGNNKLSAAAVQYGVTSQDDAASFAQRTKADGYGAYMTYALDGSDQSGFISAFTQQLYGQNAHFSG